MARRKGYFLLEALLGLLLLAALGAALFPAIGVGARALDLAGRRARIESEGTFAMDFMVGKIRPTLRATTEGYVRRKNEYTYRAYNENYLDSKYTLFLNQEKLKLELYNGRVQPITGETSSKVEEYAFEPVEGGPVFVQDGQGPLHISYQVRHRLSGEVRTFETSVVTYADYYRKGGSAW